MERLRFYRDLSADLHSKSDKSVYFGLGVFIYLIMQYMLEKSSKNSHCFPFHLVYFDSSPSNYSAYKILRNHHYVNAFFCKIKFYPSFVCLPNALTQQHKITSHGLRQANLVLIAYASSKGLDEPAHLRSLARTSAACSYKQGVKRNLQTESQIPGPSEWLGMRS